MSVAARTWAEPVAGPSGDPQLGCDLPLDLRPVHCQNELLVTGWAVASTGGISAIEVEFAGRTLLASFGLPSPFLSPAFGDAGHNRYELRLDTSDIARGEHALRVRARTTDGAVAELSGTVVVEPFVAVPWRAEDQRAAVRADQPAMWCETPNLFEAERVTPPFTIRGWAHHPSGIAAVAAFFDGTRLEAVSGLPRSDLRESLGPAVVWAGGYRIRVLPESVSPGLHDVAVVAYPAEGDPIGVKGRLEIGTETARRSWARTHAAGDEITMERYVPDRHVGTSVEIEHQARYRWAATLAEGEEVLDAGCGTGWGTAVLARGGAARVVGVDVSEIAVKHGQHDLGDLAELRVGDLCALDLPDTSFDLVVCFEAIEHLDDPSSALDHLRRVLRPGGLLLVSTPVKGIYPEGNPFHLNEYEPGELEAALRRRFAHVRADRQRTQAATLLCDDATMATANVERRLDLEVRKTDGVEPGRELYTVVCASDSVLPPPPRVAVLGEALDHRGLSEQLDEARAELDEVEARATFADMHVRLLLEIRTAEIERTRQLEADLAEARTARSEVEGQLEADLAEARTARSEVEGQLRSLVESASWRATAPLRAARRVLQRKNP
jgi:2-polyprenyl-3-methyl-5-hydroxy-6-metoxy-1,4-benzoquinol methylase